MKETKRENDFHFCRCRNGRKSFFLLESFYFLCTQQADKYRGDWEWILLFAFFSFYFARIRCQEGKKNGWLEERGTDGEKVIHMHIGGILWEWKWERYTINTEYFSFSFTEWQKGYTQLCTACVSFWDGQAEKSFDLSRKEKKQIVFIHMMWIVVNKFVNNVNKCNFYRKKNAANEVSGKSCSPRWSLILWEIGKSQICCFW